VGLLFHINGIHFPGYLSSTYGVTFEQLSQMGPFDAWNAVPLLGQIQVGAGSKELAAEAAEGWGGGGGAAARLQSMPPLPADAATPCLVLHRSSSRLPAWSTRRSAWTRRATTPRAASRATSSS
jgi:hypothetical protein